MKKNYGWFFGSLDVCGNHSFTREAKNPNRRRIAQKRRAGKAAAVALLIGTSACQGKAIEFYTASGFDGTPAVTNTGGTEGVNKALFQVTLIAKAPVGGGIPAYTDALPFNEPVITVGDPFTVNTQTHFEFNFDYPANNFQLASSALVIDTTKDESDTEAIFVDGVLSGVPVGVNNSSPYITHRTDSLSGAAQKNTYYLDWSLTHYKPFERNTFDLNIPDLLTYTPVTSLDLLSDGWLPVITADDSPIYQAFLVMKGYTISPSSLSCVTSDTFTFENVYLHEDGNSIGTAAFSGTVRNPRDSWTISPDTFQSVEFYFDAKWPSVDEKNIAITSAELRLLVRRSSNNPSAIVINGAGISSAGFDRTQATAIVEEWVDTTAATTTWNGFLTQVPNDGADHSVTLNLLNLLGASKVRTLVAQGKLNVSIAGGVSEVSASNYSSARAPGIQVSGPEFAWKGTYYTDICEVPDDPTSPLSGAAPEIPTVDDGVGPVISSISVQEITSTSAKILWLTDEPATSQVRYGLFNMDQETVEDTNLSTFHEVVLEGLLPYKWYFVEPVSRDNFGNINQSIEEAVPFRTLR